MQNPMTDVMFHPGPDHAIPEIGDGVIVTYRPSVNGGDVNAYSIQEFEQDPVGLLCRATDAWRGTILRIGKTLPRGGVMIDVHIEHEIMKDSKRKPGPDKQFPYRLQLRYDDATKHSLDRLKERNNEDAATIIRQLIQQAAQ